MAASATVVFVFDSATPVEVTAGVLYVPVVLMAVRVFRPRGVMMVSMGAIVLTTISHFLSSGEPWATTALINRALGISTIGVATIVSLKNRSMEMALQRAELDRVTRLITLGELTATIAHEVKQPLSAMVTNGNACLQWLAKQPPNLSEARQAAEGLVKAGYRAGEVIERIRALIGGSPTRKERFNLNEMIVEAVALTQVEVEQHNVLLQVQLSEELPPVPGDRIQLQQVILNLLVNAIEAMRDSEKQQRNLLLSARKNDSDDVLVTVRDSGPGLARDNLDRVFEAFHTTKSDGMGIGLSVSRSIIERHQGHLWATPNDGAGATFLFSIPAGTNT